MAKMARERLVRLLDSRQTGSFSAQLKAPAQALELEVTGVGRVRLPVPATQAKRLIAVARPAVFGRREETLLDTSVRDTWEIAPAQVSLGGSGWADVMEGTLEDVRNGLGLPPTTPLRAELHSMLVYGKGQFFLPHQDSEKADAMVGTLVMSLPSAHTGGELIVEHAGESTIYRASREELTFVAFYADCRHQVTPLRSGHRVTLTFNLIAEPASVPDAAGPVAELARCLIEHFATPATAPYRRRELDPPNRLVYLLDHEYTQRGLAWKRLKGADARPAALLRAAAADAGCEAVLALAEVRETWDALPMGEDSWDEYGYHEDEDEDEDDADDDADSAPGDDLDGYDLNELLEDEITLGWWTSPDGRAGEPIRLPVSESEVCAVTPSAELEPYRSEYEGYTGNDGNTLDRWYRRAAVVVWPRDRAFVARAEASSQWGLQELGDRIEAGDLEWARAAAASLAPFWGGTASEPGLLGTVLAAAAGLGVAETAAMLLGPFRVETLAPEHAAGLAAVAEAYGVPWTGTVLGKWFTPNGHATGRHAWIQGLPALCQPLRAAGSPEAARQLVAGAWGWMSDELRFWMRTRSDLRQPQLELLGGPLLGLLEAADDQARDEMAAALRGLGDPVLECLIPALRSGDTLPTAARRAARLDVLAEDCAERLGTIIARPPRDAEDWSIEWAGCGCELCQTLRSFLGAASQRTMAWPLAAPSRRHVHTQIDLAGLPVRHMTRRQGRPYTLLLTKTEQLFTRESDARQRAVKDLAWLRSAWEGIG